MTTARVLIAGATGTVGREVLRGLAARGVPAVALVRPGSRPRVAPSTDCVVADPGHDDLTAVLRGVTTVISALGASVAPRLAGRASYDAVDRAINLRLLEAARAADVARFVYIGVAVGPGYTATRYVRAHEAVIAALAQSGLDTRVVRPTGIFESLDDLIPMARRGLGLVIGDGKARTNPVAARDVAAACIEAACVEAAPRDLSLGGPEVFTREELVRLAFAVCGKRPRLVQTSPTLLRASAVLLRPLHPRLGDLLEFVSAVSTSDALAPPRGALRFEEHLRARVA